MHALPKVRSDPQMPRRILIVDDEPEPLRAAARVLRRAGYEVSTAEDGQGALVGMSRGRFDAVVSDISMPGMDGIALLQNIRDVDPEVLSEKCPEAGRIQDGSGSDDAFGRQAGALTSTASSIGSSRWRSPRNCPFASCALG